MNLKDVAVGNRFWTDDGICFTAVKRTAKRITGRSPNGVVRTFSTDTGRMIGSPDYTVRIKNWEK